MFHVALKFQYLHTSTLPPCTFALATLKIFGGKPGTKAAGGQTGGLVMHTESIMELVPAAPAPAPAAASAPQVVPARGKGACCGGRT